MKIKIISKPAFLSQLSKIGGKMKKYIMKIFSKYLERIDMLLQVRTVNSMVIGNEHFSKDTVFSDRLAMDKQMVFQTKYDFSNNGEDK